MQPWPMAYAYLPNPRGPEHEPFRVIIHRSRPLATETGAAPGAVVEARNDRLIVAAGQGAVQLLDVQVPGKKSMDVSEFVNGHAHRLVGRSFLLNRPQ